MQNLSTKNYETAATRSKGGKGKIVYIKGLRVWKQNKYIHITTSKGDHKFIEKGDKLYELFDKLIKTD
jgi:hypothetical protein